MKRTTIADIARLAQVSRGAVSLALNNKPGVSEQTRERVVAIARSLGWTPNAAARALSCSTSQAVGLVVARPRASVDAERFYFQFICGVESVLTPQGKSLVLHMVDDISEELAIYRSWWAQQRVDSVLLVDPRQNDPRPALLSDLGMPFVTVGSDLPGGGAVLIEEAAMIADALEHLAEQGRRRVAYVCGFATLQHTLRRQEAFTDHGARLGLRTRVSNPTDYSEASGGAETRRLLAGRGAPDAIVFDNEILTLGGLAAIHEAGLGVPGDIAVLSLEDSPVCRVVSPQVTAFVRDPSLLGCQAASLLTDDADPAGRVLRLDRPKLAARTSTLLG